MATVEKRGPKVGDSASLWNFTLVPGWTHEEVAILKLALMKFGVGKWKEIVESDCLPGKLIQQLNGQTQRLLGQQSLAAFTGMRVDVDKVRADNNLKQGDDVVRKSGLIIRTGAPLSKEDVQRLRTENQLKYGVSQQVIDSIQLEHSGAREATHSGMTLKGVAMVRRVTATLCGRTLDETAMNALPRPEKLVLMLHLHRLAATTATALQAAAPIRKAAVVKRHAAAADSEAPKKRVRGGKAAEGKARAAAAAAAEAAEDKAMEADGDDHGSDARGRRMNHSQISQLMQMGFDRKKAVDALAEADGNLEAAVEWLFATMA